MWIWLTLFSAILLGSYDIVKKQAVKSNSVLWVLFGATALSTLFLTPFFSAGPLEDHLRLMAKAVLVSLSWISGLIAIKLLPLTTVSTIKASRPMFVLLFSLIIFHENQIGIRTRAKQQHPLFRTPFRQKISRRGTVAPGNENGSDSFPRCGVRPAEGAENQAVLAGTHAAELLRSVPDDLVNERQRARLGVGIADAERTPQNAVPHRRDLDVDKLSRLRLFCNIGRGEDDSPVEPLQAFVFQNYAV